MPKGVPNKRYTPEFKRMVVETMEKEHLSIYATMQEFGINDHKIIERWERIYLEEGPEGLSVERRGRGSTGRPKKLPKEVEEDLLAEVQRLRAENDYLKTCKPWFWKTSDASTKNADSSETKAKTRTQHSTLDRSTAPCDLLLSSETDKAGGYVQVRKTRNHSNLPRKQGKIRLSSCNSGTSQPKYSFEPQDCPAAYEGVGLSLSCQDEKISLLQGRSGQNRTKSVKPGLPRRKAKPEVGHRCDRVQPVWRKALSVPDS